MPSSSLITGTNVCRPMDIFPLDMPTMSPTSGHLSIILNLFTKTFKHEACNQTLLLLSDWMQEICVQAENYIAILNKTQEFQNIISSFLKCAATTNCDVSAAVCNIFDLLLNAKGVTWPESTFIEIVDLAIVHSTSFDKTVQQKYGRLLMNIPLNIVIPKLNKETLLSETKVKFTYIFFYFNFLIVFYCAYFLYRNPVKSKIIPQNL